MEYLNLEGLNILFDKLAEYIINIEGKRSNLVLCIRNLTERPRINRRHYTLECDGVLHIYHEDTRHPVAVSASNHISIALDRLRERDDSIIGRPQVFQTSQMLKYFST